MTGIMVVGDGVVVVTTGLAVVVTGAGVAIVAGPGVGGVLLVGVAGVVEVVLVTGTTFGGLDGDGGAGVVDVAVPDPITITTQDILCILFAESLDCLGMRMKLICRLVLLPRLPHLVPLPLLFPRIPHLVPFTLMLPKIPHLLLLLLPLRTTHNGYSTLPLPSLAPSLLFLMDWMKFCILENFLLPNFASGIALSSLSRLFKLAYSSSVIGKKGIISKSLVASGMILAGNFTKIPYYSLLNSD